MTCRTWSMSGPTSRRTTSAESAESWMSIEVGLVTTADPGREIENRPHSMLNDSVRVIEDTDRNARSGSCAGRSAGGRIAD